MARFTEKEKMEKVTSMVDWYNENAFTHNYIFGYVKKGYIYGAFVLDCSDMLKSIIELDISSTGAIAIKYRPNKKQIAIIESNAVKVDNLGTVENFNSILATMRKNGKKYTNGDTFEYIIANKYGCKWSKNHEPFWSAPDLEINGIGYQLKFNKATFTTMETINR